MRKLALAFAVFWLLLVSARAQSFDLGKDRVPMTELHGTARFHTGDDPDGKLGWANPGYDDSKWPLARVDEPWSQQGYKSDSGFAWYRFQIVVPAGQHHLGIYAPFLEMSYEIYVSGRLVAKHGGMPPKEKVLYHLPGIDPIYPIPGDLVSPGKPVQIALRLWHLPYWTLTPAGPEAPLMIGDAPYLEGQRGLAISENLRNVSGVNFLFVSSLLAIAAGLGLFLLRPGEFEYLWFALSQVARAAIALLYSYPSAHFIELRTSQSWEALETVVYATCFATFLVTFLKQPRRWIYWGTISIGVVGALAYLPFIFQWIPAAAWYGAMYPLWLLLDTGILLLILIPALRGVLDARLLLGPQILMICASLWLEVIYFLQRTGHFSLALAWQARLDAVITWPFTFPFFPLINVFWQFAVLAILILRFARTSREEERHATELESARTVQQVLVPAENPSIPGFAIEAVYCPAGEVGGDFFQVVATQDGGVLLAIGDVSGKGMPAAMTVSLLVGTFRTLAHYTQSPAEILAAMNTRMAARSQGGFTTCMVLRLDADGTLTAANAGHIAPYLDGREMEVANGLPLGLAADAEYAETVSSLSAGNHLTLLTDGVVEARNSHGELFGFERTRELSTQAAESVAAAAQRFGQEDDITVLSVSLAAAAVLTI